MSYRAPFRRAVALCSATLMLSAALLGGAAPAQAETSDYCPEAASTRLVTVMDANRSMLAKLWIYQPSPQTVYVCFVQNPSNTWGVAVFRTGLTGSLVPTVTPVLDDTTCPTQYHVLDPVDVTVRFGQGLGTTTYACVGVNDTAVRVSVQSAGGSVSPDAELWFDRNSAPAWTWCDASPGTYGCAYGPAVRVV